MLAHGIHHQGHPPRRRRRHRVGRVRDVGHAHHVFAGVLTDTELDGDTRVVTFANGFVAELIVDLDDDARRIAYAVVDGPFQHHHASMEVIADPTAGAASCGSPTSSPTTSPRWWRARRPGATRCSAR